MVIQCLSFFKFNFFFKDFEIFYDMVENRLFGSSLKMLMRCEKICGNKKVIKIPNTVEYANAIYNKILVIIEMWNFTNNGLSS